MILKLWVATSVVIMKIRVGLPEYLTSNNGGYNLKVKESLYKIDNFNKSTLLQKKIITGKKS